MLSSAVRSCSLAFALLALAAEAHATELPNVVIILADDMGYGDVHALNERSKIPTPNLDRIAREGMTFTDAHTPSGVCTPTRYGLVTGRYCWRTRLKSGVLWGESPPLIDPDRTTIGDVAKARGHHTAVVGKWHLGLGWRRVSDERGAAIDFSKAVESGPGVLGFDFSYLVPASLDMPPYVYVRNGRVVELPTETQPAVPFPAFVRKGPRSKGFVMEETLDHLVGQATGYIRDRAAETKPFLLYFPFTAPHKPVLPHRRFRGKTELGDYGDFVHQVDAAVGTVLKALDDAGVAKQTLLVFTSDNGSFMFRRDDPEAKDHLDDPTVQAYRADRHTANFVFRGTKADIWEGGHHVPFIVRWPDVVKPGTRRTETICLTDLLATVAEVLGVPLDATTGEDSFSLLPLLRGEGWTTPRPPVVHHSAAGMFAIRKGQWKLVLGNGSGGREAPRGKPFAKPFQLFDLSEDIGERRDRAAQEPELVDRLTAVLEELRSGGRSVPR
jgi:arylsulfatase A-like enzyme